jgi:superfamily I DNA and/or RNA helicase
MLATKFVLVGDHYQLPPLVQVYTYLLVCLFSYFYAILALF